MSNSDLLLEAFLPYRLSYLTNMISQDLAKLYTGKFGIAHTEWRVMAVLGVSPGISAGQVAQKTAMDKVAVSRAINNMIKDGLIKREFSDADKRRSELKLSKNGRKMYEKIVPLVQNYEQKLMETLNQDEQAVLDLILNKLTRFVSD
ncbi:MAG: MarR family transcriptional regulator [Alphaproteobacteria bacterium]|nr:MarR family transcriptional regulator [Alphaproteobacteria bacterium]HPF45278.1 MarR family transcriptional regulator [Emcibacteraceae bacterium]HRW28859.1 MarR family transcriptional regulator [Emcibacteraceae bacterium]